MNTRHTWRWVTLALSLAVLLPATVVTLAGAQDISCEIRLLDPLDDVAPESDIVEACVTVTDGILDAAIRTQDHADAFWWLEMDVNSRPFEALAEGRGQGAVIVVDPATGESVCDANGEYGAGDGWRYILGIDLAACFGADFAPVNVRFNTVGRADATPDIRFREIIDASGAIVASPLQDLRLAGADRFSTSAAVALYAFPDGASEVYLARSDNPADALSGGALTFGPVLLVPGNCGSLPEPIREAILTLRPQRAIALGGPAAVCDALLAEANALL